jgi:phospholipase/lecithinase/hemolysin
MINTDVLVREQRFSLQRLTAIFISSGFKEVTTACCGSGRFNGKTGCTPNATLCDNRHEYLFWDLLHPTHATSKLAAVAIYNGSLHFAAPINFRQLVEDQS